MKSIFLLLACACLTCNLFAQNSRTRFSIGPEFSLPTYREFPSNGIGLSAAVEFRSRNRFSTTIDVGYNHFKGTVVNPFKLDTVRGFYFIPVLVGVKYSFGQKFYASMRAGASYGKNSFIGFTLSPAAGVVLRQKLDLGIRLIGSISMPSIPENNFLDRGGFSYLNFRAAIVL